MTLLTAHGLSKAFGDRVLFEDVALTVNQGDRVGVVGVNGCGKSTLLKILAGQEPADQGTIALRKDASVAYLAQEPVLDETLSAREEAYGALAEQRQALQEHQEVSAALAQATGKEAEALLLRLEQLTAAIEHHGGWEVDHRVEAVMTALGLPDLDRPIKGMSGGERRRLALGKVLLAQPDLLLLSQKQRESLYDLL